MNQCLFCLKSCNYPPPIPDGGILGAVNCKSLEIKLLQHFVLRKVLNISRVWCEEMIKKYGDRETSLSWMRICGNCAVGVSKAWNISQKLISLESTFKEVQDELKEKMLENMGRLRKKTLECVENDIRQLLFPDFMSARKQPKIEVILGDPIESGVQAGENKFGDDFIEESTLDEESQSETTRNLDEHKKKLSQRKVKRNPFLKCNICPARLKDKESLQNHMNFHEETKQLGFVCSICSHPARSEEELEIHEINEHDKEIKKFSRSFSCGKCDFSTEIWKKLRDHATNEHPGIPDSELGPDVQLKCSICSTDYPTINILINHQKKMHPEMFGAALQTIQCDQCSQIFPSAIHLHYHVKAVHKRLNAFICDLCGKGFSQKRRLERHHIMHAPSHKYICPVCGVTYSYSSALTSHLKRFHPALRMTKANENADVKAIEVKSDETFRCKYCDLTFPFKVTMLRHLQTHKEENGIKCEICLKFYVNKQGLKQHMKLSHPTTNQQTSCPFCLKLFSNPHAMRTHSMRHCKVKKMNEETKVQTNPMQVISNAPEVIVETSSPVKPELSFTSTEATAMTVFPIYIDTTISSITLPTTIAFSF